MGQILHGRATTTEAVRWAIQHSQESIAALAGRHGINPKTVQKWKKRQFVHDAPMGPKDVRSAVLTPAEEAAVVAFRKYTLRQHGRLLVRPAKQYSAPDALIPASLLPAA